mgnify:CR=1 FL=1
MPSHPLADHPRRAFMRIAGSGLAVLASGVRPHAAWAQAASSPLKIGMIGAGLVNPPMECFANALEAFASRYGARGA